MFKIGDLVVRHTQWLNTPYNLPWTDVYEVEKDENRFGEIKLKKMPGLWMADRFVLYIPENISLEDFL